MRAKSAGGILSDYSNRAKAVTAASVVHVNFNYTMPDADFPWNNIFASPTFEATFDNLINQSGVISGLSLTLTKIFNGEFTAGVVTGNNSGVVPDKALASDFWLDNTQVSQFKVSGLNHSRRYRVGFWGSSSSAGWFKGNYTSTFTINGRTVYLNSWMNSSKMVFIDNVIPDENGEMLLDFSTTQAAAYGFNGGFIVEDYSDPEASQVVSGNSVISNSVVAGEDAGTTSLRTQAAQLNAITMHPNPVTDNLNIDFNNVTANNNISLEVYDLSGRITYRRLLGKLPQGGNTVRLNAADAGMKTGIYIVTLSVNGKSIQANKILRLEQR